MSSRSSGSESYLVVRIPNLLIWCFFALLFCNPAHLFSQSNQLDHPQQFHVSVDGSIFINQNASYQLFLHNADSTAIKNTLPIGDPNIGDSFTLPEGRIEIGFVIPGQSNKTQVYYVDGTPPVPQIHIDGHTYLSETDQLFTGKNVSIRFTATDNLSGVDEIYVSVNGADFLPQEQILDKISREGEFEVQFYAVDNVGNVSEIRSQSFINDFTDPLLSHQFSGNYHAFNISSNSQIVLNASDEISGIRETRFQINDDEIKNYDAPISLNTLSEGTYTFTAITENTVGSLSDTLQFTFVIDDTPPILSYKISDPQTEQNGTIYIHEETSISFFSEDEYSPVDWIRYSVDGSDFQNYHQPIHIDGDSRLYNIRYQSADVIENISDPEILRVFLDNQPPVTDYYFRGSYTATDEGYTINAQTEIILESVDLESGVDQTFYTVLQNGEDPISAWQKFEEPIQISEDGSYQLHFKAIDHVGNENNPQSISILVDSETGLMARGDARSEPERTGKRFIRDQDDVLTGPHSEPVYLFISDSPDDDAQGFLIAGTTPDTDDAALDFQNPGPQVIRFAIDDQEQWFTLTTDPAPPQTELKTVADVHTTISDTSIYNTDVSFELRASDDISGVENIFWSLDYGPFEAYEHPIKDFLSQREYNLRYYAVDAVGNQEPVQSYTFFIDATSPRTRHELVSNYSGAILSPQSQIRLVATDNLAGVENTYFRFNNDEFEPYTGTITLRDFDLESDQIHSLEYYSVDKLGNQENPGMFNFRFHQEAPLISYRWQSHVYENDDTYYIPPDATLLVSAEFNTVDIDRIWYQKENLPDGIFEDKLQFPEGFRGYFQFGAVDQVGNRSDTKSINVIRDDQPPRTTHQFNGRQITQRGQFILGADNTFSLHARDAVSGVARTEISINNSRFQTYSSPISFSESGEYNIRYRSRDKVGNLENTREVHFMVDANPPEISIQFTPEPEIDSATNSYIITPGTIIVTRFRDEETEVLETNYQIDDNQPQRYLRPLTGFRSGQEFTLTFTATDILGNTRTSKNTIKVK